jgi:hypothetical protein
MWFYVQTKNRAFGNKSLKQQAQQAQQVLSGPVVWSHQCLRNLHNEGINSLSGHCSRIFSILSYRSFGTQWLDLSTSLYHYYHFNGSDVSCVSSIRRAEHDTSAHSTPMASSILEFWNLSFHDLDRRRMHEPLYQLHCVARKFHWLGTNMVWHMFVSPKKKLSHFSTDALYNSNAPCNWDFCCHSSRLTLH